MKSMMEMIFDASDWNNRTRKNTLFFSIQDTVTLAKLTPWLSLTDFADSQLALRNSPLAVFTVRSFGATHAPFDPSKATFLRVTYLTLRHFTWLHGNNPRNTANRCIFLSNPDELYHPVSSWVSTAFSHGCPFVFDATRSHTYTHTYIHILSLSHARARTHNV
jgi:hypothetical protein